MSAKLFFHHRAIAHYIYLLDLLQNRVSAEGDDGHKSLFAERVALVEDKIANAVIDRLALDGVDVLYDVRMVTNY